MFVFVSFCRNLDTKISKVLIGHAALFDCKLVNWDNKTVNTVWKNQSFKCLRVRSIYQKNEADRIESMQ